MSYMPGCCSSYSDADIAGINVRRVEENANERIRKAEEKIAMLEYRLEKLKARVNELEAKVLI